MQMIIYSGKFMNLTMHVFNVHWKYLRMQLSLLLKTILIFRGILNNELFIFFPLIKAIKLFLKGLMD